MSPRTGNSTTLLANLYLHNIALAIHTVVLNNSENALLVSGLLPDEIGVGDLDDSLAELVVDAALGGLDYVAVNGVLVALGVLLGRGESSKDLLEVLGGESADGVTGVEENGLAVGLVEDGRDRTIILGDADTIEVDPVAGLAIGRLSSGDDGALLEVSGVLLGVDTTVDDGTAVATNVAQVEGESTAFNELLAEQVVNDERVRAVEAVQRRTGTEDTGGVELRVGSNTKDLLGNLGGTNGHVVVTVLDVALTTSVAESGVLILVDERRRATELTEALAVFLVVGLGAVGVDPELGGSSVEVDADGLSRCTHLELDGVEVSGLAVANVGSILALRVLEVLGETAVGNLKGETKKTLLLDKVVIVEDLVEAGGGSRKRQSRERKSRETHGNCIFVVEAPA